VVAAIVTIGDGVPTPGDAVGLAGVVVAGAVVTVFVHAAIRTIAAIHMRRTRRG
jgi:hypothetical protein